MHRRRKIKTNKKKHIIIRRNIRISRKLRKRKHIRRRRRRIS